MPSPKLPKATEAQLDALSQVSQSDIDAAVAQWDRDCSPRFRGLLRAIPDTGAAKIDRPLKLPEPP